MGFRIMNFLRRMRLYRKLMLRLQLLHEERGSVFEYFDKKLKQLIV